LLTGNYLIKITVTDPKTAQTNSDLVIDATIFCTKTIDILSDTIASFTYKIDWDQGWTSETALPVYEQNPKECAVGTISRSLVYTGVGTAPTFITQDLTNNLVAVTTNDTSVVGAYAFKIVATDSLTKLVN
jgi:hypothetical protein